MPSSAAGADWAPIFRVRGGCQCRALGWPGVQIAGESTGQGGWAGVGRRDSAVGEQAAGRSRKRQSGDGASRRGTGATGGGGRRKSSRGAPEDGAAAQRRPKTSRPKTAATREEGARRREDGVADGRGQEGRRREAAREPESRTALVRRARRINRELAEVYPYAHPELDFENPFQLLVATVLSAQTTDLRVNQTTPALFAKYPTPEDMAAADPEEVEEILRPTGFFRAKTKSVIGLSTALRDDFGGEVPGRLEDLVKLPGVGRKTAIRRARQRLRRPGHHRGHPLPAARAPLAVDRGGGPGEDRGGRRRALPRRASGRCCRTT